jgi:hypothetical protein
MCKIETWETHDICAIKHLSRAAYTLFAFIEPDFIVVNISFF